MRVPSFWIGAIIIMLAGFTAVAGETGFTGGRLQVGFYSPNSTDGGLVAGPNVITVNQAGSQFDLPASARGNGLPSISATDNSLLFDYSNTGITGSYPGGNFVGFIFTTRGEIPPITNVTINTANTTLQLSPARVWFNDHQIFVNVGGLAYMRQTRPGWT